MHSSQAINQWGKAGRRRSGLISLPVNFESLAETEKEYQPSDDEDDEEAAPKAKAHGTLTVIMIVMKMVAGTNLMSRIAILFSEEK
jgi:hypothetical protein